MTDDWAGYGPATYGDRIAGVYDLLYGGALDTTGTVERLADLAGEGPVLELGVGTGRIACPLAERGIAVHGIDASEAMVAALRARPGGDRVAVTVGDFADAAFAAVGLRAEDHVRVDPAFVRPPEPTVLVGDARRARTVLGWEPEVAFGELVAEMVEADVRALRR